MTANELIRCKRKVTAYYRTFPVRVNALGNVIMWPQYCLGFSRCVHKAGKCRIKPVWNLINDSLCKSHNWQTTRFQSTLCRSLLERIHYKPLGEYRYYFWNDSSRVKRRWTLTLPGFVSYITFHVFPQMYSYNGCAQTAITVNFDIIYRCVRNRGILVKCID